MSPVCVMFQFKYAPLYLEWAPVGVFRAPTTPTPTLTPSTGAEDVEMKEEASEETSKKQVSLVRS